MRARVALVLSATSLALGAGLVACVDLFHSTAGILPLCEVDAQADGCAVAEASVDAAEAGSDAAIDFCSWGPDLARANAQHACAWLGACESPMGDNAFGACMVQALLAFDCASNPNHPVQGDVRKRWDCLWRAQSCADIDACVFQGERIACGSSGDYTSCAQDGGDVRIECTDGGTPHGESCALWGQTCASDGAQEVCAGASGSAGLSCTNGVQECIGTALHDCQGSRDVGLDCAGNGAGQCAGFPAGSPQWVACVPLSDAGACTPDASVSCQDGIATSCPAGALETINCQELLGTQGACNPQDAAPPFDWTSACQVVAPAPPCDGDAGESCDPDAGTITSCARGVPFTVSCSDAGLGDCQMLTTDNGSTQRAACTPP